MTVAGIDGCPGGWVAVILRHPAGAVTWHRFDRDAIGGWLHEGPGAAAAAVAIDIPIGLPQTGRRACDIAARQRIPGQASTVFPAPLRPVLTAPSYAAARALLAERREPSISAQGWGIVPAVAAVDVAISPGDEGRIVEAHPEVSFAAMAQLRGELLPLPPKRTPEGRRRRELLATDWCPDALADARGLPAVDALDAVACAWTAMRWLNGRAETLGDASRDRRGLLMRIVV